MLHSVSRLYQKKISSKGLSIFRILFALNLFFEVFKIYRFRELYFDPIPFVELSGTNYSFYLIMWMIVLGMLALGAFTRIMSIANYLLTLFFMGAIGAFEYHMDFIYLGVGFLMMITPLSRSFSIDRWYFLRKAAANSHFEAPPEKVPALYYNLLFLVGIGFVYFGSVFFKFKSDMWMSGLGIWLPASIPQVTILNDQWLLNQEYLMKFLGYFTLVFEILLPFIFYIKKLRCTLFLIGVVLHIGILFEFPIPYFALGVVVIYFLIVPVGIWERWTHQLKKFLLQSDTGSSAAAPLNETVRTTVSVNPSRTRLKILGLKILIVTLFVFQFNATFNFPFSDRIVNFVISKSEAAKDPIASMLQLKKRTLRFSKKYLGIAPHGVFVDGHFNGYNKIITVRHKGELLPMYDQDGMPGDYLSGGSWANFNFRVNKPNVMNDLDGLKNGLIRYTSFWAHENDLPLEDLTFEIVQKDVSFAFEWEKDLLATNRSKPWKRIGYLNWSDSSADFIFENE